jgi:hypothetical protein
MRKIILLEHITVDGFVAGSNGEVDWIYLLKCLILWES